MTQPEGRPASRQLADGSEGPEKIAYVQEHREVFDRFESHSLKVVPPYFDALASGDKTFEVRKNDRGYQRGDLLYLTEWHPANHGDPHCVRCVNSSWNGHYVGRTIRRWVSFVYAGDPRFSGIEPGHVVLGLVTTAEQVER